MVNSIRIKENRPNHKGQSLVEVAVFGSFLLLVLGFLLSQGLQYNYQQEVKMEAFRRALLTASQSNIPKPQQVQVIKDVHIPDPSDMFALGERSTIQSAAGVFWSNGAGQMDYKTPETTPSTEYVFNPDSNLVSGVYRNWTISALDNQPGSIIPGNNLILEGNATIYHVGSMDQTRVYQADPGFGPKQVMVLMSTGINCQDEYCEKTILGQVEYTTSPGGQQFYPVFNVTSGEVGSPPGAIDFINNDGGDINATLGKQQVVNKVINKDRSLTLNEDAHSYTSIERLNDAETLKHVIMTQSGDQGPSFTFGDPEPTKTWTTQK